MHASSVLEQSQHVRRVNNTNIVIVKRKTHFREFQTFIFKQTINLKQQQQNGRILMKKLFTREMHRTTT